MDQLQPVIRFLKAHHFWLECALILLIVFGGWFLVTSDMRAKTDDRKTAIEGQFTTAQSVAGIQNHPNDESHEGMDAIVEALVDEVEAAWTRQYEIQEDVLVWPSELTPEFRRIVEKLRPAEKVPFPTLPAEEPLDIDQRGQYRNYISNELPELAKIAGARWTVGQRGLGSQEPESGVLVNWNTSNQSNLLETRFSWPKETPTTLEVLYAQEDLWILTALMNIVANTNGNITARYQANIKTIDFIDLGPDAIGVSGSVMRIGLSGGADGGGMGEMGMDPSMGMGEGPAAGSPSMSMGGASATGSSSGGATQTADPGDFRYVDKNYKPLSASRLRQAAESKTPEDAFLAVAKRIPVRMRLKIDQRKINRFLAECGSYKLPVEVHQVRINCKSGSTFRGRSGGGGGEGMGPGGMMGGPGMDGEGAEMFGGAGGAGNLFGGGVPGMEMGPGTGSEMGSGAGSGPRLSDDSPWDVDLEVYGIVYLYNPVDREKIGKKLDSAAGPAGSAAPSSAPATPAGPTAAAPNTTGTPAAG